MTHLRQLEDRKAAAKAVYMKARANYISKEEAVNEAAKAWDALSEADKKSYIKDAAGTYRVDEIEITAEQFELYKVDELAIPLEELSTATVWEAE